VTATVSACNFYLHALLQLRSSLPCHVALQYHLCLIGLHDSVLWHVKFQATDGAKCCCTNCLPCSLMSTSPRRPTKGSPLILTLRGRVDYKVAVLRFEAVKLQQPSYLTCLLSPYRQSSVLRSSASDLLSSAVFIDKHCCLSVLMLHPVAPEAKKLHVYPQTYFWPIYGDLGPHFGGWKPCSWRDLDPT